MKLLKRCGLLWVLAMAVLTVGAAACGDGPCMQHMVGEAIYLEDEAVGEEEIELLGNIGGAEEALAEGMRQLEENIDVREYGLTIEELSDVMNRIATDYPELFHLGRKYSYYPNGSGGVNSVVPTYVMNAREYEEAVAVYKQGVEDIAGLVDEDWSPLEQILFVHDYLAANYEYDESYTYYDAYNFFVKKTGVCEAYTETFVAVMKELRIEVSFVMSDQINHVWNLVSLNGKWYHLDVTHDDPTRDNLGYAGHNNFLLSEAAMLTQKLGSGLGCTGSGDWVYGVSGTIGNEYDNYFWRNAVSPFVEEDDVWYYVERIENGDPADPESVTVTSGLRTWDGEADEGGRMVDFFEEGIVSGPYIYGDNPSYAGLSEYEDKLYYNSSGRIKCYDPEKGEITVLETIDPALCQVVGLRVDDGTLNYEVYFYPPEVEEGQEQLPGHSEEYTLDIRPFIPVGENVYSYHAEDGKVELKLDKLPEGGYVLMACYDENDAFVDIRFCTESDVYDLPDGTVKLFAVSGGTTWVPLCEGVKL